MIREVSFNPKTSHCSISWNVLPWKFEAGTPNVGGAVGLMEAVRYLERIGMENVKEHEETLTEHAIPLMEGCGKAKIFGTRDTSVKCGIIPFGIDGLSSHDVALFLDNYGIMVRSGFHCAQPLHEIFKLGSTARVSFYIYNTLEEIDRFSEILKEISRF